MSWQLIKKTQEEAAAQKLAMRQLLDKAQNEKRDLSEEECKQFDAAQAEYERLHALHQRMEAAYGSSTPFTAADWLAGAVRSIDDPAGPTEWRDAHGNPVRVFAASQKLAIDSKLSMGRAVRSMITGDWSNAQEEQRALSTSASSAGFLVPITVAAGVIDAARAQAVCVKAGAQFVQTTSGQMTIAKVDTDPVIEVKAENEAFSGDDMAFGRVPLTARTIGCVATISRELAADAPNAAQAIEQAIANALAVKLDYLALFGAGGTEPTGLSSVVGIQEVAGVGALTDYSKLLAAWTKILAANGQPNAYVLSPRDAGTLEGLREAANGQYLRAPAAIAAMQRHITSSIAVNGGTGQNESMAFMGDFTRMLIGLRQDVLVEVTTNAGDAFDRNQVKIKATWRGDIGLAQPQHFAKLTGITVAAG